MHDMNVHVAVRIRPLVPDEVASAAQKCLSVSSGQSEGPGGSKRTFHFVSMGSKHNFAFDSVFDEAAPQRSVYTTAVLPLVDGLFAGYNGTVLAYGQTGSGKTYTMGSSDQSGVATETCVNRAHPRF